MKKDYTAWIVGAAVVGAFIVLICAWVFFFWIAANNRVEDVPLETRQTVQTQGAQLQPEAAGNAAKGQPAQ